MKGLILADVKVAKMMDTKVEKGNSDVIPAYIDKEGNLSQKSLQVVSHEKYLYQQAYNDKS